MKLIIKNFATIKEANISLNGITVIAGNNNSGKSTIGKIILSIFSSYFNMTDKIIKMRRSEERKFFYRNLKTFLYDQNSFESFEKRRLIDRYCRNLVSTIINNGGLNIDSSEIQNILKQLRDLNYTIDDNLFINIQSFYEASDKYAHEITDEVIARELITEEFNKIFGNQINSLRNSGEASINLSLKNKPIILTFKDNMLINEHSEIEVEHDAFLIDSPLIVNSINNFYDSDETYNDELISKIANKMENNEVSLSNIFAKEKLSSIISKINNVVRGDIVVENSNYLLKEKGNDTSTKFINLSTGLKTFVLLKMLLENNVIKESDVLIFDEPEVHLHPQWQIVYAELIVLLQKEFNLSIVVTTHSKDFVEAIELFSQKYEIFDKCSFYISSESENGAVFNDLDGDVSEIYAHLISPSELLDKLRFELENKKTNE